jgi:hypothetical protein
MKTKKLTKKEIHKRIEKVILLGDTKINTRYPMQAWKMVRTKLQELLIDIRG